MKFHKGGRVIKGKITKNISNTYIVKSEDGKEFEAVARGKFKMLDVKPICRR
ncbi:MAG: hypothetical protein HFJ50_07825 [Clostridia bacterium]|nr:hypothetical protein [Clostridia bacterium]